MGVQVGEGVAENFIIHLQRPVVALEGLGNPQNLQPVPRRLGRLKLGWLRHMPSSPDHECVPSLHVGSLEVGVTVSSRLDTDAEPVVIGPALRAHRTASARNHRVPVCWPCRGHDLSPWREERPSAAVPRVARSSYPYRSAARPIRCGSGREGTRAVSAFRSAAIRPATYARPPDRDELRRTSAARLPFSLMAKWST
jgi:hypothetical protein